MELANNARIQRLVPIDSEQDLAQIGSHLAATFRCGSETCAGTAEDLSTTLSKSEIIQLIEGAGQNQNYSAPWGHLSLRK